MLGDRIRLTTGTQTLKAITGDLLTVPAAPHMLRAVEDSALLLSVSLVLGAPDSVAPATSAVAAYSREDCA